VFKVVGGHIDMEEFLASERNMFDLLVNSVGEGQVFDGLV
jgi:hypothetical protein